MIVAEAVITVKLEIENLGSEPALDYCLRSYLNSVSFLFNVLLEEIF